MSWLLRHIQQCLIFYRLLNNDAKIFLKGRGKPVDNPCTALIFIPHESISHMQTGEVGDISQRFEP
jgi:hypothetical protein